MPNSVAKGRSRIALLAVLAVLASLFVLPAAPASAATTGEVEFPPSWTACPADAIPDAGFTDVTGSFAADNIDCIAYYGVTQGTSASTYSPAQVVTRWQMALFLTRLAGPAGISVPAASDQGFTDIAALPQATQDAINQIAALGISKGTSATTFDPMAPVSRYQMALFLIRFLEVQNGTASLSPSTAGAGFTDIDSVSFEAYNAIQQAYDHGITTGTTATTFSPYAAVTREQMAAFLTRTAAWTNARPAGVTIQAKPVSGFGTVSPEYHVYYRDSNFQPAENVLVDLFYATWDTGKTAVNPVKADGTIDTTKTTELGGALEAQIDNGDRVTNSDGNITLAAGTLDAASGMTVQLWGWTGALNEKLDVDSTTPGSIVIVSNGAAASAFSAKADTPKYATTAGANNAGYTNVKFGTSYTVTLQATDGADPVAQSGIVFTVFETRTTSGGNVNITTTKVTSGASGSATYSVAAATDPDTTNSSTDWVSVKLSFDDNASLTDATDLLLEYNDNTPVLGNVTLTASQDYGLVSTGGSTVTATATAYSQFGYGLAGEVIDFKLNGGAASNRTTNSAGVAAYAFVGGTANGADTVAITTGGAQSVTVYWAEAPTGAFLDWTAGVDADSDTVDFAAGTVVVEDDANNKFVAEIVLDDDDTDATVTTTTTVYVVYTYDADDQLTLAGTPQTLAQFNDADLVGRTVLDVDVNTGASIYSLGA